MLKFAGQGISPTVATIFSDFLEKLKSEAIVDSATIERLSKALEGQKLDSQTLRAALLGESKSS